MIAKLRAAREQDEKGFTLIELLVVILIIAILAAIAIPVFLKQREKGWVAQMQSASKNATTAAESYATGTSGGNYASLTQAGLVTEGWKFAADVVVRTVAVSTDNNSYCIIVGHNSLGAGKNIGISSNQTTPTKTTAATCTAGDFTAGTW